MTLIFIIILKLITSIGLISLLISAQGYIIIKWISVNILNYWMVMNLDLTIDDLVFNYILLAYLYYSTMHIVSLLRYLYFYYLVFTNVETLAVLMLEIKEQFNCEKDILRRINRITIKLFLIIQRVIHIIYLKIFRR